MQNDYVIFVCEFFVLIGLWQTSTDISILVLMSMRFLLKLAQPSLSCLRLCLLCLALVVGVRMGLVSAFWLMLFLIGNALLLLLHVRLLFASRPIFAVKAF